MVPERVLEQQRREEEGTEIGEVREALRRRSGRRSCACGGTRAGRWAPRLCARRPGTRCRRRPRRRAGPSTTGLDHPKLGRNVNAKRNAATHAAIEAAPAQSRSSSSHADVATAGGSLRATRPWPARPRRSSNSGTCRKNIHRHPKSWITGPPMATPITGPPAPTSDQKPERLDPVAVVEDRQHERHRRRADGRAHHPAEDRAAMSTPMFGASAERAAATVSAMIPTMNSRRWPNRSPALPTERRHHAVGEQRPGHDPGGGPKLACRPLETSGKATTNTVKSRFVASRPDSATHRHPPLVAGAPTGLRAQGLEPGPQAVDASGLLSGVARSSGEVGPEGLTAAQGYRQASVAWPGREIARRPASTTAGRHGRHRDPSARSVEESRGAPWQAPRRSTGRPSRVWSSWSRVGTPAPGLPGRTGPDRSADILRWRGRPRAGTHWPGSRRRTRPGRVALFTMSPSPGVASVIRVRAAGAMAFTRTPYRPSSCAAMTVNAAMPALAAP